MSELGKGRRCFFLIYSFNPISATPVPTPPPLIIFVVVVVVSSVIDLNCAAWFLDVEVVTGNDLSKMDTIILCVCPLKEHLRGLPHDPGKGVNPIVSISNS